MFSISQEVPEHLCSEYLLENVGNTAQRDSVFMSGRKYMRWSPRWELDLVFHQLPTGTGEDTVPSGNKKMQRQNWQEARQTEGARTEGARQRLWPSGVYFRTFHGRTLIL